MSELPPDADDSEHDDGLRLVEALPFAGYARRQAQAVEARMLATLKRKLDSLDRPADSTRAPEEAPAAPFAGPSPREPGAIFAQLLERSLEQRQESAERDLLLRVVDQLTCDEARIVSALSDGNAAPACQIGAASRVGLSAQPVLRFASRVGVEAGVMLRDQVPAYLVNLHALGLIETGPEDRSQSEAYDMLMSDEPVREAIRHIEQTLELRARVSRFSLHLSTLGQRLWRRAEAAHD